MTLREMASSTWRSPIRRKPSSKTSIEAKGVEMQKRKDKWIGRELWLRKGKL